MVQFLKTSKNKIERHKRIATEGALTGSITYHGFNPELAIISDDAGQFKVFLHGLCWVHAERAIQKIVGFNDHQNQLLEEVKSDIWQFYRDLKKYRVAPDKIQKHELEGRFNKLFTRKTGFITLDLALKRIFRNKTELLLVLKRPDIPLHNNLSEREALLLELVGTKGSMSISEIGSFYPKVSSSTISTTITRLWKDKKLVDKRILPENQRITTVNLTDRGRFVLEQIKQNQSDVYKTVATSLGLSVKQNESFQHILEHAIGQFNEMLGLELNEVVAAVN